MSPLSFNMPSGDCWGCTFCIQRMTFSEGFACWTMGYFLAFITWLNPHHDSLENAFLSRFTDEKPKPGAACVERKVLDQGGYLKVIL